MEKVKVFSLFSGMGAFEEALKQLKIPFECVGFSEIDKQIANVYSLLHDVPIEKNYGDVTKIDEKNLPSFDLLVGGSPCQNISNMNLKDRRALKGEKSSLFFEYVKVLNEVIPKYFIFENVKRLKTVNNGKDYEMVCYLLSKYYDIETVITNSKHFGVSHNRERLFIIGIRKDLKQKSFNKDNIEKKDVPPLSVHIEKGQALDYRYYVRDETLVKLKQKANGFNGRFKVKDINKDVANCLLVCGYKSRTDNFIEDVHGIRGLTERERFSLQGFNPNYVDLLLEKGVSKTTLRTVSGNTITVNVVKEIFKELFQK